MGGVYVSLTWACLFFMWVVVVWAVSIISPVIFWKEIKSIPGKYGFRI